MLEAQTYYFYLLCWCVCTNTQRIGSYRWSISVCVYRVHAQWHAQWFYVWEKLTGYCHSLHHHMITTTFQFPSRVCDSSLISVVIWDLIRDYKEVNVQTENSPDLKNARGSIGGGSEVPSTGETKTKFLEVQFEEQIHESEAYQTTKHSK